MAIQYITETSHVLADISEKINHYIKKKHKNVNYRLEYGTYGITIHFNSEYIQYSLIQGLYDILKKHGYTRKGNKNKHFDIRKTKDDKHRVRISYYVNDYPDEDKFIGMYIIPEYKLEVS